MHNAETMNDSVAIQNGHCKSDEPSRIMFEVDTSPKCPNTEAKKNAQTVKATDGTEAAYLVKILEDWFAAISSLL
jgi:hypothetical protein